MDGPANAVAAKVVKLRCPTCKLHVIQEGRPRATEEAGSGWTQVTEGPLLAYLLFLSLGLPQAYF